MGSFLVIFVDGLCVALCYRCDVDCSSLNDCCPDFMVHCGTGETSCQSIGCGFQVYMSSPRHVVCVSVSMLFVVV